MIDAKTLQNVGQIATGITRGLRVLCESGIIGYGTGLAAQFRVGEDVRVREGIEEAITAVIQELAD